jgi:hypothetical protein
MNIPAGLVRVKGVREDSYITAVAVKDPAVAGQPGCAAGTTTLTFNRVSSSGSRTDRDIMLPYGTWALYTGGWSGSTSSSIATADIIPLTNVVPTGMVSDNEVTLDPRAAG